jgi:hypothetical protein
MDRTAFTIAFRTLALPILRYALTNSNDSRFTNRSFDLPLITTRVLFLDLLEREADCPSHCHLRHAKQGATLTQAQSNVNINRVIGQRCFFPLSQ